MTKASAMLKFVKDGMVYHMAEQKCECFELVTNSDGKTQHENPNKDWVEKAKVRERPKYNTPFEPRPKRRRVQL